MATAEATVSTQRMRFRESLLQATLCTLLHDLRLSVLFIITFL